MVVGHSRLGTIEVSQNTREDIVFIVTWDDVLACAHQMGIPQAQLTEEVLQRVKDSINAALSHWPEVVKRALGRAENCPLDMICYPSCFWWQNGSCAFPDSSPG